MKTFQKPLTAAEERLCLRRCQEGDPEAKRILIERNLRLSTFNSERSARLSTYAARCIDNELLMMLRARKKCSREVSLYEPIGTDKEGNEISLLDIIESPPVDIVEEYSTRQDIRFLFSSMKDILTPKEYQVICCRYGLFENNEMTQREIADQLHISRSYVSRIEKNALKKLKTLFG